MFDIYSEAMRLSKVLPYGRLMAMVNSLPETYLQRVCRQQANAQSLRNESVSQHTNEDTK